jgi:transcription initiation factor TFIID subunit TAF12
MSSGPKPKKRPADVVSNAVHVMRVLTGEEDEAPPKNRAAQELGSKGGSARAKAMTAEERSAIAKNAARSRWAATERREAEASPKPMVKRKVLSVDQEEKQ